MDGGIYFPRAAFWGVHWLKGGDGRVWTEHVTRRQVSSYQCQIVRDSRGRASSPSTPQTFQRASRRYMFKSRILIPLNRYTFPPTTSTPRSSGQNASSVPFLRVPTVNPGCTSPLGNCNTGLGTTNVVPKLRAVRASKNSGRNNTPASRSCSVFSITGREYSIVW